MKKAKEGNTRKEKVDERQKHDRGRHRMYSRGGGGDPTGAAAAVVVTWEGRGGEGDVRPVSGFGV